MTTAYYPELETTPAAFILSEIVGYGKHGLYWTEENNDKVLSVFKKLKIRPSRVNFYSPSEWRGLIKNSNFWFAVVTSKAVDKLTASGHVCHAIPMD